MVVIRYPLSGGKDFREESLYGAYAEEVHWCLEEKRFFEAILVCCVGLDVILNALPDRLISLSASRLDTEQIRILHDMENKKHLMAGEIIGKLKRASLLDRKLVCALATLNAYRNNVIHPFRRGQLKDKAILPFNVSENDAQKFARQFYHVIDLSGGRSPRNKKRALERYAKERNRLRMKPLH